ncbi:MAG: B12-binding domain-containing protein [Phycisphaerae bacterium]|nr:B12-binding domain-containing protein [Phycisphaerae bacterium]
MERQSNPAAFSPKQVARAISVSEASIKRWCDKGVLAFSRTAGGHRRIHLPVVLDFIRANAFHLAQPEVLGLPANVGSGSRTLAQACRLYGQALEQGDEAQCLQLVLDMRLAGHEVAVIGDQMIAPAFHAMGLLWEHGKAEIYQERRGVEITRHVLLRLKDTLAPPNVQAPVAIGATLANDRYTLPGQLGELVLLELGWQARFMGTGLPADTIARAVQDLKPRILWLSVSSLEDVERFVGTYHQLYDYCLSQQCAVVLGGRAVTESLRQQIQYASFGDNLQHLRAFAQSLGLVR